jgi:hypothetical protein
VERSLRRFEEEKKEEEKIEFQRLKTKNEQALPKKQKEFFLTEKSSKITNEPDKIDTNYFPV